VKAAPIIELHAHEVARSEGIKAAREKVDAAWREYRRAQRQLSRLEGREARHRGRFVTEAQLQAARDDVHHGRLAWQKARRELLRSM